MQEILHTILYKGRNLSIEWRQAFQTLKLAQRLLRTNQCFGADWEGLWYIQQVVPHHAPPARPYRAFARRLMP